MSFITNLPLWIWSNTLNDVNQYAQFIHTFNIDDDSQNIFLNISSDSQYVAWLNGCLSSFGQYADYPEYKVYDCIDITEHIKKGMNTLCVLGYYQGEDSSTYRKGEPGIVFEIISGTNIITSSSNQTICRIAPDYASGDIEKITPQLSFSFKYNAKKYDGWNLPDYIPDNSWEPAHIRQNTLELYKRPVEKTTLERRLESVICTQGIFKNNSPADITPAQRMQNAYMSFQEFCQMTEVKPPVKLPHYNGIKFEAKSGDGIYLIIDLGLEETGYIDIELQAIAGTVVDIGYGEHLDDMRVRSYVGGRNFAASFICNDAPFRYTHLIKRVGCRYLQLNIYASEATIYYAGILPSHYPVKVKGSFECSDLLHQKIYDVSARTLLLCMHEHYEDCPWREQALYSMDSRNQMLCGYYCFGEYQFAKASIRMLSLGLREDGLLELCAPARIGITIPTFSLTYVIQLYEYILYSGDLKFADEMFITAKKIIDTFAVRLTEDCLLTCFYETPYWNFYEWEEGLDGGAIFRDYEINKTYDAPLNAFFSKALFCFSELCRYLNKIDITDKYINLYKTLNEKIAKHFWNNEKGVFCTFIENGQKKHYCELTQALIVYCGACPERILERVLDLLYNSNNELIPVTLGYSIFKYEALLAMPEKFSYRVFDDIAKIWGDMLFKGATSFWETQKGAWDFGNAGSLCHGWSAIPVYLYHAYILGLKPTNFGFTQYKSLPVKSSILEAKGKTPFCNGEYEVLVKFNNDLSQPIINIK